MFTKINLKVKCLLLVSVLALVFSACSEQNTNPVNVKSNNSNTGGKNSNGNVSIQSSVDPSYAYNPYDTVGYLHNLGLEYVRARYISITNATDSAQKVYIADSLSCRYSVNAIPYYLNQYCPSFDSLRTQVHSAFINAGSNVNSMSNQAKSFAISIHNSIDGTHSLSTIISDIKSIENTIIANNTISSNEKTSLLCFASVARYSTVYWYDVNQDSQNEWHDGGNQASIDWDKVALEDTKGAIAGALAAAATGGGVVAGALAGAVGASATEVLSQTVSSWWPF